MLDVRSLEVSPREGVRPRRRIGRPDTTLERHGNMLDVYVIEIAGNELPEMDSPQRH